MRNRTIKGYQWISRSTWLLAMGSCSGLAIAFSSAIKLPAQGVEAPDGTVAFESGLLLLDAHTTFDGVEVKQARYYFDLELPDDIGESLQKVEIQQRNGGDEVTFEPEETEAYLGDHHQKLERVAAIATRDKDTEQITIRFEQPIAPGNKITIGLKPKSNPSYGGVYLFGVTAYPTGEKARGMYLGAGRLHFENYSDDGNF
jgi:hypothetical protein